MTPDAVDLLQRLGGTATFADLTQVTTARCVRNDLAAGRIRRIAKGVYSLPEAPTALAAAVSQGGVVSHASAALHWGLDVVTEPLVPHLTVPANRRRRAAKVPCTLHWGAAPADGHVTTPLRTVIDCARTLPFGEALAVADSALRRHKITASDLEDAAGKLRGAGRQRIVRVLEASDQRSESALESMLRAILVEAGITGFVPQVKVQDSEFSARIDLGHEGLRIALEADGFQFHGTRQALRSDCRRHANLTIAAGACCGSRGRT